VSSFTEERIRKLCSEAITLKTEETLEPVLQELHAALQEHIQLTQESLQGRVVLLPLRTSRKTQRT
jgi:hypothetical protein